MLDGRRSAAHHDLVHNIIQIPVLLSRKTLGQGLFRADLNPVQRIRATAVTPTDHRLSTV